MNCCATTRKKRQGSALLAAMGIILTVSLLLGTLASIAAQRAFSADRHVERTKAQAIAEAGVDYAYSVLRTNFAQRFDPDAFPPTEFGGGTYYITVTPVSYNMATISSTGRFSTAAAAVGADARDYAIPPPVPEPDPEDPDPPPPPPAPAFDYAILCGGGFTFNGCGTVTSTNGTPVFHSNGAMDIKGSANTDLDIESSVLISIQNNVVLGGDVTAPELDYMEGKVTFGGDPLEEDVSFVTIPDIDLTPYYNWALSHSEVKPGWTTTSDYTPNGGIVWVNGDVHVSSHADINGSIIATGDIHISGDGDVIAGDTGFSLVSRDGSIQNTSSGTIEGLIYVKTGDYDQTANGTMIGQLVVAGDIKKGGNSDIIVFERTVPTPPDDPDDPDDDPDPDPALGTSFVGISAWSE